MKILILGANGMAGHTISLYFIEKGYDITTFSTSPFAYGKNILGDALDMVLVKTMLQDIEFDAVINCIGILNKDCDKNPSKSVFLNSFLPHYISDLLSEKKTKFIQMSTDCVFSGKTGQYIENSFPDGETFYDRTKALGEINNTKDLTFRNSIIGPDMNINGIGLFNWFMKQTGTINGYANAIWTGVTTLTLAKAMESAIKENLSGIYHLVNNNPVSKLDLLKLCNLYFKDNELSIQSDNSININKSLTNTRTDFTFTVPGYTEMILEMKDWINIHKDLYPHYSNLPDEK